MSIRQSFIRALGLLLLALGIASPALAQASRTWVSGVGDDANPCSRTAPCKTFAGAISKTMAGGEIDALDPGGYGAVTISKAITIDGGGGGVAGVLVSGTNGIVIQAGSPDVVTLRNLQIDGIGAGLNGVRVLGGKGVVIENCQIFGFTGNGIDFQPLGGMSLTVSNTAVRDNDGSGIFVRANGAFFARLTATHTRLDRNGTGLTVQDNSLVFVSDSSASSNAGNGFIALSSFGGAAHLDLEGASSSNNGNAGVVSQNSSAVVRISNTAVDHNGGAGLVPLAGGQMLSFSNNRVTGNAAGDGSVTGFISPM